MLQADSVEGRERRAIVHIGTEKTGSTAVQNLLYKNDKVLSRKGFLFPYKTCGLISNFRLVLHIKKQPDAALLQLNSREVKRQPCESQRALDFVEKHDREIKRFQRQHADSTVVYSSEHFHSRVTDVDELETLRDFLSARYDSVQIVVYVRRQDLMARSAYNTAVQGGRTNPFRLADAVTDGPYYDFLGLAQRWAGVFGRDSVIVRLYDRAALIGGDVARDFAATTGIADRVDVDALTLERSNPRLSHFALEVLREYNRRQRADSGDSGVFSPQQRMQLVDALQELPVEEAADPMPARSEALSMYAHYRDRNRQFCKEWLGELAFNETFSEYPEFAIPAPDVQEAAANALDELLMSSSQSQVAQR